MTAVDQVAELGKKAAALYEDFVTIKVRFQALEKSYDKTEAAVQHKLDKFEQRQSDFERRQEQRYNELRQEFERKYAEIRQEFDRKYADLDRRVVLLEAQFKTVYQSALIESMRGSLRTLVRDFVGEEMNRRTEIRNIDILAQQASKSHEGNAEE